MTANELRIGNYIYSKGLHEYKKITAVMLTERDEILSVLYNHIEISEDILLKCGFKKDKDGVFKIKNCLYWLDIGFIQIANGYTPIMNVKCKYLHQLQNLFFALTGEELTINL